MTKQEFLAELRRYLTGLPQDEIEERISFYSEMIDDEVADGKTEEEVIAQIGNIDDVVMEIAGGIPLVKLVKEKIKPKRKLRAWEIILIILGFPLWFPLLLVALILSLVFYLLIWIFVIVSYVVEGSLVIAAVSSLVIFLAYLTGGEFNLVSLGFSFMCAGGASLFVFACIGITKATLKFTKFLSRKIKQSFIRKDQ